MTFWKSFVSLSVSGRVVLMVCFSVDQLCDVPSSAHVWTAAAQTRRVELLWLFLGKNVSEKPQRFGCIVSESLTNTPQSANDTFLYYLTACISQNICSNLLWLVNIQTNPCSQQTCHLLTLLCTSILPCVLSVHPGGQKGSAGKRHRLRIWGSAAKTAEGKADAERDGRVCAGEVNFRLSSQTERGTAVQDKKLWKAVCFIAKLMCRKLFTPI